MIVRLRNLSARAPQIDDVKAVTELLIACELAEHGIGDPTEEELQSSWQAPGFNLKTDAWVIVTEKGQIVGYAEVRQSEGEQFCALLRVHPEYCNRGIGTLLVWLVEERTRLLMRTVQADHSVLGITVSSLNQGAIQLLEREGYRLARHFWRLVIEMDEEQPYDKMYQSGKLKMDLVIDVQNVVDTKPLQKRTGIYITRQYNVYEKELRVKKGTGSAEVLDEHCAQPLSL